MNNIDFTKLKPGNYNRKSSEGEDRQVLSVPSQIEEAQRLNEFYKLPPFVEVFHESKSAKKEYLRPEFTRMMKMIESGKIDTIVCWKLDRLARNMTEGGKIIDFLSSGRIKAIITHDKVFYPWDNVIVMSVEFSQGKQFLKDLSVNVKRGQTKKAKMGYPHGLAAIGFKNDKTGEVGNRKWIVDEERLPIVKEIFSLFLTGNWSVRKLANHVRNELKLTTIKHKKNGGHIISISKLFVILKNPIYAGFFYQQGIKYELYTDLPRIITRDEHLRIQHMISSRGMPKTQTHTLAYAGYIYSRDGGYMGQDVKFQVICDCKCKFSYRNRDACPKCSKLIAKIKNPKHLMYRYYYNIWRKKAHLKPRAINEKEIDAYLSEYLKRNLNFSPEFAEWCKKYLNEWKDNQESRKIQLQINNQTIIERLNAKKKKFHHLLAEEFITPEDYKSEILEIDIEINKHLEHDRNPIDWISESEKIVELTQIMVEIILGDNLEDKRSCLSSLRSNLIWNEENLSIINAKPVQTLIDGINLTKLKHPLFEPENIVDTSERNKVFQAALPDLLQTWDNVRNAFISSNKD